MRVVKISSVIFPQQKINFFIKKKRKVYHQVYSFPISTHFIFLIYVTGTGLKIINDLLGFCVFGRFIIN